MLPCLHSELDDSTTDDLSGKQLTATVDWDNTLVESSPTVIKIYGCNGKIMMVAAYVLQIQKLKYIL